MTLNETIRKLRSLGSIENAAAMNRFGITSPKAFGVSAPDMRGLAKEIGKDHHLALRLWGTGIHEARILAALVADPAQATMALLDRWANGMENWAQCDVCCAEFFQRTKYAFSLPGRWTKRKKEFVRRAGLVMIAVISVHHKSAKDSDLEEFFPLILRYATDERNFVKKAGNWALRQIGKRNIRLNKKAIALAKEIQNIPSRSARWIASDALRELKDPKITDRLHRKKEKL